MKSQILKFTKLSLILLLLFSLAFTSRANIFKLTVKEDLANCTGVALRTCYQVKYSNSKDWELFYSEIIGFKHQAGYRYVLQVSRTKRKNVPADASAYEYKLVKVLKKTKMAIKANSELTFIAKHKWKLIQLNGNTIENSSAFLIFDAKTNRLSGNSGCNNLFGTFKIDKTAISFGQIGMTRMACDETRNKLESEFAKALAANNLKYDIADQTLNIYLGDKLVMMFGMSPLEK